MTIEQIKDNFGIESNDVAQIRKELREIVKELHPDKNSGSFKSKLDELNYHKVTAAIDFLDQDFSLVPKVEITSLTNLLRDNLPERKEEIMLKTLEDRGDRFAKSFKDATSVPKISSTVLATVLSFLWLFPSTIADHPILSKYLTSDNLIFTGLWIYSIMFTAFYWLTSKGREERTDAAVKRLNLESTQNKLFESFIEWEVDSKKKIRVFKFTKDDLIEYLTDLDMFTLEFHPGRMDRSLADVFWFIPSRRRNINLELSQSLADIIIARALERDVIKIQKGKRLSDSYLYEVGDGNDG